MRSRAGEKNGLRRRSRQILHERDFNGSDRIGLDTSKRGVSIFFVVN